MTLINELFTNIGFWSHSILGPSPRGIVSNKYKFIYYPIPKVACTSLKESFADIMGIEKGPTAHTTIFEEVKGDPGRKFSRYFKLCFVRNPFDRLVSCYHNKICDDVTYTNDHFEKGVFRDFLKYNFFFGSKFRAAMTFDDFVIEVSRIPDRIADPHFRSQSSFIISRGGALFVDFVGRFETLEEHLSEIRSKLRLPHHKLPHKMASSHKIYQDYYSNNMKLVVEKRYSRDFSLFGYQF